MAKVLSMKNGVYYGHFKGKKSFAEIKAIKEGDGVLCYNLTGVQSLKIDNGGVPTIIGGVVQIVNVTTTWLNAYKAEKRQEQKEIAKRYFKDNEFDASDSEAYKTTLKNYFVNTVKVGINNAADKTAVDNFIETINYPVPT